MSNENKKRRREAKRERRRKRAERRANITKEIKYINIKSIYYPYREWRAKTHKYFRQDNGHILKFENCPLTLFALDYVELGDEIWDILDSHPLTKWEYKLHMKTTKEEEKRWGEGHRNDTHKKKSAKRMIKLIESIREHGYCEGKYEGDSYLINVKIGYVSPYGDDPNGYTLLKYKHRTASCIGLGMEKIKAIVWSDY